MDEQSMQKIVTATRQIAGAIKDVVDLTQKDEMSTEDAYVLLDDLETFLKKAQKETPDSGELLKPFFDLAAQARKAVPRGREGKNCPAPIEKALGEIYTPQQLIDVSDMYPDLDAIESYITRDLPAFTAKVGHKFSPRQLAYMTVSAIQETLNDVGLDRPPLTVVDIDIEPRFSLGEILSTYDAEQVFEKAFMGMCLKRHAHGDWGDLDADETEENDQAFLAGNEEIRSVYSDPNGRVLWIVTAYDHSETTMMLPEQY